MLQAHWHRKPTVSYATSTLAQEINSLCYKEVYYNFNENLARNEVEGGSTERHSKSPTHLNEPQGKLKE